MLRELLTFINAALLLFNFSNQDLLKKNNNNNNTISSTVSLTANMT